MAKQKKSRAKARQTSSSKSGIKKRSIAQKANPRAKAFDALGTLPAVARGAAAMEQRRAERMLLTKPSRARVGKEVQALRDQIARDRARRHAEYLQQVDNPTEP